MNMIKQPYESPQTTCQLVVTVGFLCASGIGKQNVKLGSEIPIVQELRGETEEVYSF